MLLQLAKLEQAPLAAEPFEHVVVEGFLAPDALRRAIADFPATPGPGAYPAGVVRIRGGFKAVMDELAAAPFRRVLEAKLGIDLDGRPLIYTVRGGAGPRDGRIHHDSATKLVTVLIYFNEAPWPHDGGRLRLLRSARGLHDHAVEVAPDGGTLVSFRPSAHSWHGHRLHVGPRRAVQLNWLVDHAALARETARLGLAGGLMWLNPLRQPGA